jgi:outer membrane protein assembly factor BamD
MITLFSCSKEEVIYTPSSKVDPYILYKEGLDAFERNDFFFAEKKFSEAELNFKNIELSAKSAIMSSFALYRINFYSESLESFERYLKTYPSDKNVIYANYMLAIIYFEQISDERKDLKPLLEARIRINNFLKKISRH